MNDIVPLILASRSPRRHELLSLLEIPFEIRVADIDETPLAGEAPVDVPQRLSRLKAEAVATDMDAGLVIGADTVVVHKGEILGKPEDAEDAEAMLRRLREERHRVFSGFTVTDAATGKLITELCETKIWLRAMTNEEIARYVASGDPMDKAAGYAIQNDVFAPVSKAVGCPANVMGLPMCHVVRNLRRFGMELPDSQPTRCAIRFGYHCALTEYVMPGAEQR